MLIFSNCYKISSLYELSESTKAEHIFIVRSLLLARRVDLAHLYVMKNYHPDIFKEFILCAIKNENIK